MEEKTTGFTQVDRCGVEITRIDLENIMRRFSGSCRCCSKKVGLYYVIVLIFLVNMALRRKTFPGCYVKHL